MNAGIVTSFLVGGLLLISILQMNLTVSHHASETTLQTMAKNNMQAISDIMAHDLERMGVGIDDPTTVIASASDSNQISFTKNPSGTVQTVTWSLSSTGYSASENPDDLELIRTVNDPSAGGIQTSTFSVTDFDISYLDLSGSAVSDPSNAKGVMVSITTESPEGIKRNANGSKFYGTSHWQQTIYPANLNIFTNNS